MCPSVTRQPTLASALFALGLDSQRKATPDEAVWPADVSGSGRLGLGWADLNDADWHHASIRHVKGLRYHVLGA